MFHRVRRRCSSGFVRQFAQVNRGKKCVHKALSRMMLSSLSAAHLCASGESVNSSTELGSGKARWRALSTESKTRVFRYRSIEIRMRLEIDFSRVSENECFAHMIAAVNGIVSASTNGR